VLSGGGRKDPVGELLELFLRSAWRGCFSTLLFIANIVVDEVNDLDHTPVNERQRSVLEPLVSVAFSKNTNLLTLGLSRLLDILSELIHSDEPLFHGTNYIDKGTH
jgi:hypothetical protein